DDFLHNSVTQENLVLQRSGGKNLIQYHEAVGGGLVQDLANSNEVVLQLAPKIFDVFLHFEVSKELVEEKESRFSAWDKAAQAGQVMQLAKGAGESRFTALIRSRYHQNAFPVLQVEVIADDRRLFAPEPVGQGQVEAFVVIDLLGTF